MFMLYQWANLYVASSIVLEYCLHESWSALRYEQRHYNSEQSHERHHPQLAYAELASRSMPLGFRVMEVTDWDFFSKCETFPRYCEETQHPLFVRNTKPDSINSYDQTEIYLFCSHLLNVCKCKGNCKRYDSFVMTVLIKNCLEGRF